MVIMIKRWSVFLVLTVIFLASSWSLLHPGFFRIHDYVHAARVVEMAKAIGEGHIPPRWSANFGYGYGMPLFEFYAPLPYFVGAIFYLFGMPIVAILKILFAGSSLITLCGAYVLGSHVVKQDGKNNSHQYVSGLVAAAALTLAPYRAVNLFIRGALSEAWGIMALPWILWGILRVIRRERWGWLVMVISLVVLMLSHNITTLLFVPVSGAFALGMWLLEMWPRHQWRQRETWQPLLVLAGCYLLAIGLAAFYLFPALAEKSYTQVEQIFGGYFHYSHHFLYIRQFLLPKWGYGGSEWGPNDGMSFFLGWGQLLGLAVTGLTGIWVLVRYILKRDRNLNGRSLVVMVLAGTLFVLSLFLTLLKTKPLWDAVPFLTFVQFPWRWLAVGITFLSIVLATGVSLIPYSKLRWLVAGTLIAIMVGVNGFYFRPESYLDNPNEFYYTDAARIQSQMSSILPDYIPTGMGKLEQPPQLPFLVPLGLDKEVELIVDRGHEKLYTTKFAHETKLSLSLADFPGWKFEIDGQPAPKVDGEVSGTLAVMVPSGEHLVGVRFGATPVRMISDIVSSLSVLVLLAVIITVPTRRVDKK